MHHFLAVAIVIIMSTTVAVKQVAGEQLLGPRFLRGLASQENSNSVYEPAPFVPADSRALSGSIDTSALIFRQVKIASSPHLRLPDPDTIIAGMGLITRDAQWEELHPSTLYVGKNCGTGSGEARLYKNLETGKCITMSSNTSGRYNSVYMTTCDTADNNQMWCPTGDGNRQKIVSIDYDYYLRPYNGCNVSLDYDDLAKVNGQPRLTNCKPQGVSTDHQSWLITRHSSAGVTTFTLKGNSFDSYLADNGGSRPIIVIGSGALNERDRWTFYMVSETEPISGEDVFMIVSSFYYTMCLEVSSTDEIITSPCDSTNSHQKWYVDDFVTVNSGRIKNIGAGKYLGLPSCSVKGVDETPEAQYGRDCASQIVTWPNFFVQQQNFEAEVPDA